MNIKEQINKTIKGNNRNKKEQRVIIMMLFIFVILGFSLPTVKDKLTLLTPSQNPDSILFQHDDPVDEDNDEKMKSEDNIEDIGTDTDINTEKKDKTLNNEENVDNNAKDNKDTDNNTNENNSAVPPSNKSKVWVPPKYKTVHHEAVYKTVKVVICNYCGETFNSTGEFQVHKDIHGG